MPFVSQKPREYVSAAHWRLLMRNLRRRRDSVELIGTEEVSPEDLVARQTSSRTLAIMRLAAALSKVN